MERICEKRREDGLHGLAIQWGIVGQVGFVAEKLFKEMEDNFELQGSKAQSLQSCLQVLDTTLQQPLPVVSSFVLAQKGTRKEERVGLLFRMEKIFGITDFKSIPRDKKLSELGLDSLVAAELKQLLEREHEILLTKEHLKLMSVADIISIDAGTLDASKLKRRMESGQEMSLLPLKLHTTSLLSLKSGHPSQGKAFIVYGVDGGCDSFIPLASRLNASVYGFQFTGKDGWDSISELSSLYVNEIRAKEPTGPYTILGFSAGTSIALEIVQRLQALDEKAVQNLIFLDGSPSYENQNLISTFILDILHSMSVLRNLSQDSIEKFKSALTGEINHDTQELFKFLNHATGYELTPEQTAAYGFLGKQLAEHNPRDLYNGDIILVQATDPSVTIFKSSEDYNVSKYCTGQVIQHRVRGNHFSFLSEENVNDTSSFINQFLK